MRKKNIVITPSWRPLVLNEDERKKLDQELRENQERLWKRIDEAKRPPTRPPASEEVSANGIPLRTVGISTTGIDSNYRLVERKRDFGDTVFYMLSALRDVITNNKTLSADQREHLRHTRDAFEKSIWRLQKYFGHNEEDIDLLEAMIAAAYEIGSFGAQHPIKRKLGTMPASGADPPWLKPLKEIGLRIFTEDPKIKEEAAVAATGEELEKLDIKKLGIKKLPGRWAIIKRLRAVRDEMGLPRRRKPKKRK